MTSTRKTKGKPTNIDKIIGANLIKIRKTRGVSQTKLAEALGISFQQIQKYEKGTNRISASMLLKISQAMDVSIQDFYAGLLDTQHSILRDISASTLRLAIALESKNDKALVKSIERLIS